MGSVGQHLDVHKLVDESKNALNVITIEATVITGFEFQALEECKEKCKPISICKAKGRIFFNIPIENFQKVYTLKSVDNLFLVGESMRVISFEGNKVKDLDIIKSMVKLVEWKNFITTWSQLMHFKGTLFPDKNIIKKNDTLSENKDIITPSTFTQLGGGDSKKQTSDVSQDDVVSQNHETFNNKVDNKNSSNTGSLDKTEKKDSNIPSQNQVHTTCMVFTDVRFKGDINDKPCESGFGQGDTLTLQGKELVSHVIENKDEIRSSEINVTLAKDVFKAAELSQDKKYDSCIESNRGLQCESSKLNREIGSLNLDEDKSKTKFREDIVGDSLRSSHAQQNVLDKESDNQPKDLLEVKPMTEKETPKNKGNDREVKEGKNKNWQGGKKNFGKQHWTNRKKEPGPGRKPYVNDGILKYRVTCYRAGTNHSFSSMDAAAEFGGKLQDEFGWTVDLTRFDLNVLLVIEQDSGYITSAITKESFHRRNITHFAKTTLRATMCYNLIRLAQPVIGEIILDPLCGGGSISIEGAISFPGAFHICGDKDESAMTKTQANYANLTKGRGLNMDVIKWDAIYLPLNEQSVDIFVTDLPFGKRSGERRDNFHLYKNLLIKLAKIVRMGTGRAALLTFDRKTLTQAVWVSPYWKQMRNISVNQGGLNSSVFLLLRTSKIVTETF